MEQQYIKISEFSKLVGVSCVTLRDWERRGWLVPHHRTPSGYRYYTKSQADNLLSGKGLQRFSNMKSIES